MRSLYWFRSDLRVEDNVALADAMRSSEFLIAIFILTPETWKAHAAAPCKIQFLLENLKALSERLWAQGIPLLITKGPSFSHCPKVLQKLCNQYDIDTLYFNQECMLDERKRDEAVTRKLAGTILVSAYCENLVLAPGSVLSQQGKSFQMFSAFKNEWLKKASAQAAWRKSTVPKTQFKAVVSPDPVPSRLQGFSGQKMDLHWPAGEYAAHKMLKEFCKNKIIGYKKNRDYPFIDGTSQLSPYLVQGVLSARQCISFALNACALTDIDSIKKDEDLYVWISELIWREFYHHIAYFNPDIFRHKPLRLKTNNIPWLNDLGLLDEWKKGMTGFPIVDAGMRQLLKTGWMHNRLRMIVAMFLSKILLLDWRLGERHFMEHLIDGDFAANNGGWQWCASTGTDSAPYFRIFNPTTQSKRFDPKGDFIRRFCPELSHLEDKVIHDPYGFGVNVEALGYPKPMVDYKAMRQNTLSIFKTLSQE